MPLTFGSFGDVVTLAELVLKVIKALRDSSGSSYEYQTLIMDVESFRRALLEASRLCDVSQDAGDSPSIERLILDEVAACHNIIDTLFKKVLGDRDHLKAGGSRNKVKDIWRKVLWMFKRGDLAVFRERLAMHTSRVGTMLAIVNCSSVKRATHELTNNTTMVARLDRNLESGIMSILSCIQELPNRLGYTWEGGRGPDQEPVVLDDALGRRMLIPFECCGTYEQFRGLLAVSFQNTLGSSFVSEYTFDIRLRDEFFVHPFNWQRQIWPGVEITMAINIWDRIIGTDWKCDVCGSNRDVVYFGERCWYCQKCVQILPM